MRPSLRSRPGPARWTAALGLVAALVAACSSGSASTTAAPTEVASTGASLASSAPTPSAPTASAPQSATPSVAVSPSPAPTGPAAFQLTVSGDANVTGTWGKSYGISCDNPTFDGYDILFVAQSPDGRAVVLISLTQGSIGVSERHGAGAEYTDREFQGTEVTTFDAARGASFDADLTIVPGTGQTSGILGTITHVAGSVDCGNQGPGTSTVQASGATAQGTVSGAFIRSRVACNSSAQYGASVSITAIIDAGTTPTLLIIALPVTLKATVFSVSQSPAVNHSYTIAKSGTMTLSSNGTHLDADFTEVLAAGAAGPAHTIHLAGDVTCGTSTTS